MRLIDNKIAKNMIEIVKEIKFKYILLFWFIISIQFVIGSNLQTKGYSINSLQEFIICLIKIVLFTVIFIVLHYCVLELINRIKEMKNNNVKKEIQNIESKMNKLKKYRWVIYFLIIIASWIPVLLAFYPCCLEYDGGYQIQKYYFGGEATHHPILITKLYTFFYAIGVKLGSATIGMLLFSICQMTFMAGVFSFCVKFIEDETNKKWIRNVSLIFYALYPYNQLFSMTTTKDVIFAGLMLIFTIHLYKMMKEKYKIADYIFIVLIGIVMLLSRNNAIYTMVISLPILIFILLKDRKKLLKVISVFLIVIVSYKITNSPLYKVVNTEVEKAKNDEGSLRIGTFSQAIGRISRDIRDELTDYEKEKITYYFTDYKKIGEEYEENIADVTANYANSKNINSNEKEFLKFMLELLKKYPMTCIDSLLDTTRGFWYINDVSFSQIQNFNHPGAFELYNFKIYGIGKYKVNRDSKLQVLKNLYVNLYRENKYQNVPILYVLFQPGIYFYMTLAFLLYSIYKKEKNELVVAVFLFVFYASCFLANCSIIRYMYPVMVSMPLMLGLMVRQTGQA